MASTESTRPCNLGSTWFTVSGGSGLPIWGGALCITSIRYTASVTWSCTDDEETMTVGRGGNGIGRYDAAGAAGMRPSWRRIVAESK